MSSSFTRSGTREPRRLPAGWTLALAAAAAAGLWARVAGFGERGFAVDEYFFFLSAGSILEYGLPRLLDGGFYIQGLLPQYLVAASIAVFGKSEAAVRVPALLGGLALPVLTYRYVRSHGSREIAVAVAVAVLLSSWQIELSRFGRMYTLFACATLLLLTSLDGSLRRDGPRRYTPHFWAVVAVLCHREGALLAPLLFAPWLHAGREPGKDRRWLLVTLAVAAGIVAFAGFDFRRWGVLHPYPAGYERPTTGVLRLPEAPLWGADPMTALIVVAVCLALVLAWSRRWNWRQQQTLAALACVAAALHQLALAGLFGLALAARSAADASLARRLGWVSLCAAGWPIFAAATDRLTGLGGFRRMFFGWPQFYDSIWRPWSADLPWVGAAILAAAAASLWQAGDRWREALTAPAGVAAYAILCFGLLRYFYESTRYHYFLYPVLLATVAFALAKPLGRRGGAVAFLAFFVISGDFDPRHVALAGTDEAALRMGRFEGRANLWYPRSDYRAIGSELTALVQRAPAAKVVIGTAEPVGGYFDGDYVRYLDRAEYPFWEQSRRAGTVELWSGRPLLSTAEQLRAWSAPHRDLLLVRRVPGDLDELDPRRIWGERLVSAKRAAVSRDGGADIVRVRLRSVSGPPRQ